MQLARGGRGAGWPSTVHRPQLGAVLAVLSAWSITTHIYGLLLTKPRRRSAAGPRAAPSPASAARLRAHRSAGRASLLVQPPSVHSKGACKRLASQPKVKVKDVIDLGAPRLLRKNLETQRSRRQLLQRHRPNPRLYPGPTRVKPKATAKHVENRGGGEGSVRRRKRVRRRVVPNSRLYRPAPARPPPPPAAPRATWPPPAPPLLLDTASRAALRLSEQRPAAPHGDCARSRSPPLVVSLPYVGEAVSARYRPASQHFRLRSLDTESDSSTPVAGRSGLAAAAPTMDAANRNSTSPEDCSDGNETLSAPSEFLAEFLSAIMRRQYAEALKYCRLILQYEPHNATARGFFPLLQHKVQAHKRPDEECPRGSSSEEASAPASETRHEPSLAQHEMMEQGGDSSECSEEEGGASRSSSRSGGSCGSQSSLELDSSEALAHSSASLSLSRRTEHTDSASGGCWESTGSASRSDADDNGNATTTPAPAARLCAGDVENDNAAAAEPLSVVRHKETSSLQRLRAQFTCSIK